MMELGAVTKELTDEANEVLTHHVYCAHCGTVHGSDVDDVDDHDCCLNMDCWLPLEISYARIADEFVKRYKEGQ